MWWWWPSSGHVSSPSVAPFWAHQQALGWLWAVVELRSPGFWSLVFQSPELPKGLMQICQAEREQAGIFLCIATDLALCIWHSLTEGVERNSVMVVFIFLIKQLSIPLPPPPPSLKNYCKSRKHRFSLPAPSCSTGSVCPELTLVEMAALWCLLVDYGLWLNWIVWGVFCHLVADIFIAKNTNIWMEFVFSSFSWAGVIEASVLQM